MSSKDMYADCMESAIAIFGKDYVEAVGKAIAGEATMPPASLMKPVINHEMAGKGALDRIERDAKARKPRHYVVTMDKYKSTWTYFTRNPEGGGFGSNFCGAKRVALSRAIRGVPKGAKYEVITNGKSEGVFTKEG